MKIEVTPIDLDALKQSSRSVGAQPPAIPDHTLLQRIGGGSYGEVWLARSVMGTLRAVKIVHRTTFDHDRPYEREFDGIQNFEPISRSHEGLVDLLQVGRNDANGYFYYVMELADDASGERERVGKWGSEKTAAAPQLLSPALSLTFSPAHYTPRTLRSEIQRHGRLPLNECIELGRALTSALAFLHEQGLVHRDIKPSNIIFVGGQPKLADVGLVTGVNDGRSYVGTEGFIPPEGPGAPQADLYSLGILLYQMSTGKSHQDFPEPLEDLATQPDHARWLEFNAVIHKACAAEIQQRYQSAEEMLAELVLLQRGESVRRKRTVRGRIVAAKRLSLTVAAVVLLLVGVFAVLKQFNNSTVQRINGVPEVNSIAVLPFVSQNTWGPHEYLAAILSDETRNALTNCSGLRVVPSHAVRAFSHATNSLREIGKRLGVQTILAGTLNKPTNQLIVAAKLINVADGTELWSATYDHYRRSTNIPKIASQVVSNVAQVLKLSLPPSAFRQMDSNFIQKLAAYRIYSVASTNMDSVAANTQDGFDRTIQLLNETLAKDQNFASAYADLADTYVFASGWHMPPNVAMPAARMNAQRALLLDPSLWKAHCALGMVCANHELDFTNAEFHYLRAIQESRGDGKPYINYAGFLSLLDRPDEAEKMVAAAEKLDPTRASFLNMRCLDDYRQHRYEEMLARATRFSTLYPDSVGGFLWQARAYERLTNYAKALEMAQQMKHLDPSPDFVAFLGLVQARLGDTNGAQRALADLRAIAGGRRGLPPYDAFILLGLGQTNQVIERLQQAVDEYRPNALFLKSEAPIFDELRFDPRFIALLKKAGLEK